MDPPTHLRDGPFLRHKPAVVLNGQLLSTYYEVMNEWNSKNYLPSCLVQGQLCLLAY
jgi:hypothetical protein